MLPPDSGRELRRAGFLLAGFLLLTLIGHYFPLILRSPNLATAFYVVMGVGSVVAYGLGYLALTESAPSQRQRRLVVGFALVFAVVASLTPPFHSSDLSGYINRGWQQVNYGQNPYVHPVSEVPEWRDDPMLREHWIENPAPYGFLFVRLTSLLCYLGGGNWWLTALLFKLVNAAVYTLLAWISWLACKRLGRANPERDLYLFLWNPLVLMHGLANGHNDLLLAFLALIGFYATLLGGGLALLPALVAGALVKYLTVIVTPFALLYLVKRHGWRRAALSSVLAVALIAAFGYAYLGGDWHRIRFDAIKSNATLIHTSIPAFVHATARFLWRDVFGLQDILPPPEMPVKMLFWAAFIGFFIWQFRQRWRAAEYSPRELIRDALLLQFLLVCVVSSKFQPWYLLMLLPLALWLEEGDWLRQAILLLSCTHMLSLPTVSHLRGLEALPLTVLPIALAYLLQRMGQARNPATVAISPLH